MEQMGIHCLWVHRSAERDRRPGDIGATAVSSEPVQQYAVPVPRLPAGPIRGLYWEGGGFVLVTKRLEEGSFQWPRNSTETRQLSYQQHRWLMEGLKTE